MKRVLLLCGLFLILSGCANSGNFNEAENEEPQKVNWQDLQGAEKRIVWLETILETEPNLEKMSFAQRAPLQTECESFAADRSLEEDSDFRFSTNEYLYAPRWDRCLVKENVILKSPDSRVITTIYDALTEERLLEYANDCDSNLRSKNQYSENDIWKRCVGKMEIENVWRELSE